MLLIEHCLTIFSHHSQLPSLRVQDFHRRNALRKQTVLAPSDAGCAAVATKSLCWTCTVNFCHRFAKKIKKHRCAEDGMRAMIGADDIAPAQRHQPSQKVIEHTAVRSSLCCRRLSLGTPPTSRACLSNPSPNFVYGRRAVRTQTLMSWTTETRHRTYGKKWFI